MTSPSEICCLCLLEFGYFPKDLNAIYASLKVYYAVFESKIKIQPTNDLTSSFSG